MLVIISTPMGVVVLKNSMFRYISGIIVILAMKNKNAPLMEHSLVPWKCILKTDMCPACIHLCLRHWNTNPPNFYCANKGTGKRHADRLLHVTLKLHLWLIKRIRKCLLHMWVCRAYFATYTLKYISSAQIWSLNHLTFRSTIC